MTRGRPERFPVFTRMSEDGVKAIKRYWAFRRRSVGERVPFPKQHAIEELILRGYEHWRQELMHMTREGIRRMKK